MTAGAAVMIRAGTSTGIAAVQARLPIQVGAAIAAALRAATAPVKLWCLLASPGAMIAAPLAAIAPRIRPAEAAVARASVGATRVGSGLESRGEAARAGGRAASATSTRPTTVRANGPAGAPYSGERNKLSRSPPQLQRRVRIDSRWECAARTQIGAMGRLRGTTPGVKAGVTISAVGMKVAGRRKGGLAMVAVAGILSRVHGCRPLHLPKSRQRDLSMSTASVEK